jgi:LysM repeat protein
MRHDDHTPHPRSPHDVYDADSADRSDLTEQFWGAGAGWEHARPRRTSRIRSGGAEPTPAGGVTGPVRALRDGLAAFRPQRLTGASNVDRTREHGIVRPGATLPADVTTTRADRRVPIARSEATLGELASGAADDWFDAPIPHRPAARRTLTDVPTAPVRHQPAPIAAVSFDEIDELDGYDEPDAWVELERAEVTPAARRWAERVGLSAVDPLIARVGVLLVVTALLVPLALALRSGRGSELAVDGELLPAASGAAAVVDAAATPTTVAPTAAPVASSPTAMVAEPSPAPSDTDTTEISDDDWSAPAQTASSEAPTTSLAETQPTSELYAQATIDEQADEPAEASAPAERGCGQDYTIVAGDSWYRIAAAADVSVDDVLAVNAADTSTVLLPGDEICLPQGAQTPAPPSTAAPATTAAPTTSTVPTTTAAPATTAVPTTTAASSGTVTIVSRAEAQQIIRDVWPDELEEKALQVAERESNFYADADNGWCCVGLFQIYWTVHQSWLDDYGIVVRDDLKDARKNAQAAYALYQRAGGWGPWGG